MIPAKKPEYEALSHSYGEGILDVTKYTTLDGLPQSITSDIRFGPDGNIWLLSVETLSKFDGTFFTVYNRANGLLRDTYALSFLIDQQGKIWIGTTNGVTVFNGKSFATFYNDSSGNEIGSVPSLIEGSNGVIWLGTSENGLFKVKGGSITRYHKEEGLTNTNIRDLILDDSGLLIAETEEGFFQYNGTAFSSYDGKDFKTGDDFNFLLTDSKGHVWYQTESNALVKTDGKTSTSFTMEDGFIDGNVFDALEDEAGNIWFASMSGLQKFTGLEFIYYSQEDLSLPPDAFLSSLALDSEGSLWLVSPQVGLLKVNFNLTFIEIESDLLRGDIWFDLEGNRWVISEKGLGKYERDRIIWYNYEPAVEIGNLSFDDLKFDRSGNIWFLGYNEEIDTYKLVKFDGGHFSFFGADQGLNLKGDVVANLYSQTDSIFVIQLLTTKEFIEIDNQKITRQKFLPNYRLTSYLEDSEGNKWFGTAENGLFKYNSNAFSVFNTRNGLENNRIIYLTEDQAGNVWATIDYGITRFNDSTFTTFNAQDGLANLAANVVPDTLNDVLWFGTISGLVSLDASELNTATPVFKRYNPTAGFSIGPIVSPKVDNEGNLWGVSIGTAFKLNYRKIKMLLQPELYIKNIQLNNQQISWLTLSDEYTSTDSMMAINEMGLRFGEQLTKEQITQQSNEYSSVQYDSLGGPYFIPTQLSLPFEHNTISVEYATVSPSYGKATRYQYRLEGYQDNWSQPTDKTDAIFGNLPEGSYTFQLRALNAGGNVGELFLSL